jgi:apolipoprotein N-acyltransferase
LEIRMARRLLPSLLAFLSGVLVTFGFGPFGQAWAPPLGLAAALWIAGRPGGFWRGFRRGWWFGFGLFVVGLYWIYIPTHVYGHAAVWLACLMVFTLTGYLALWIALVLGLTARAGLLHSRLGWFAFPALWTLAELLRGTIPWGGFPWLSLGYSLSDTPFLHAAPLIGAYGLSALVALIAYALVRIAHPQPCQRPLATQVVALLVVVLLPLIAWLLPRPTHWTRAEGAPLSVALVQPGIGQATKFDPETLPLLLQRYQIGTYYSLPTDLVLWPEDAMPLLAPDALNKLSPLIQTLKLRDSTLIFGVLEPGERNGHRILFNSALEVGKNEGRYDKRHLVPFGEYFPIPKWLKPLVQVMTTPFSNFTPGRPDQPPLMVNGVPVAVSICFEDAFPDEFRIDARASRLLVNLTNDAWFGRGVAPAQHLQFSLLRAAESGRWLARATPTGITGLISPDGHLTRRLPSFSAKVLRGEVQPRAGVTPFQRWGDRPLWWLAAILSAAGLLPGLLRRRSQQAE